MFEFINFIIHWVEFQIIFFFHLQYLMFIVFLNLPEFILLYPNFINLSNSLIFFLIKQFSYFLDKVRKWWLQTLTWIYRLLFNQLNFLFELLLQFIPHVLFITPFINNYHNFVLSILKLLNLIYHILLHKPVF